MELTNVRAFSHAVLTHQLQSVGYGCSTKVHCSPFSNILFKLSVNHGGKNMQKLRLLLFMAEDTTSMIGLLELYSWTRLQSLINVLQNQFCSDCFYICGFRLFFAIRSIFILKILSFSILRLSLSLSVLGYHR